MRATVLLPPPPIPKIRMLVRIRRTISSSSWSLVSRGVPSARVEDSSGMCSVLPESVFPSLLVSAACPLRYLKVFQRRGGRGSDGGAEASRDGSDDANRDAPGRIRQLPPVVRLVRHGETDEVEPRVGEGGGHEGAPRRRSPRPRRTRTSPRRGPGGSG